MKRKLPPNLPTFLVKVMWRATALTLKVQAKDEESAWQAAAKQVKKMEGGMYAMDIKVLGVIA